MLEDLDCRVDRARPLINHRDQAVPQGLLGFRTQSRLLPVLAPVSWAAVESARAAGRFVV